MADIQFGVNFHGAADTAEFEHTVRHADGLGFDVLAAPDHLGAMSPFSLLASAAVLSSRMRLRTYVLNVGFWNPALLAREVATLDLISGGRAELGIGAGHMKSEHDDAGLPWLPFQRRIELLESTVTEVRRRLSDPDHQPAPVQQPVPLMVAAMSSAGLAVAASHADVVGFAGLRQVRGQSLGTFTLVAAEETAERVAAVREQAKGRPYRSDVLLQHVLIGPSPSDSAATMADAVPWMTAEEVMSSPFVLYSETADEAAAELTRRHEAYGFDSVTTHQPSMEELGKVIAAYRG
jgi:probable F420-dependent oxidoreductase